LRHGRTLGGRQRSRWRRRRIRILDAEAQRRWDEAPRYLRRRGGRSIFRFHWLLRRRRDGSRWFLVDNIWHGRNRRFDVWRLDRLVFDRRRLDRHRLDDRRFLDGRRVRDRVNRFEC